MFLRDSIDGTLPPMVQFTNAANLVSDKLESVKEISADTQNDLVKIDPE